MRGQVLLVLTLSGCVALSGCIDNKGLRFESREKTRQLFLNDEKLAAFTMPEIAGAPPEKVTLTDAGDGWHHVLMSWNLDRDVKQDELSVEFSLGFEPDFWWAPHLAPNDGDCIAQHVFRSPAIIASKGRDTLVMVPDIDLCGKDASTPWFMDYDARKNKIWLGMSKTNIWTHVGYRRASGMVLPAGEITLGFYVTAYADENEVHNPWEKVSGFFWERYARPLYQQGQPVSAPLDRYVEHTYNWAFDSWKESVWQEFEIDGKRVGAPQFIVNFSQSPNYPGQWQQREFLSIWNQAWFSSLRSASGLARWAQKTNNADLLEKANLTKELALAAPFKEGIFSSVIGTDTIAVEIDGEKVFRPKGWDESYWTNSNRCPSNHGISARWYHVLDASWTSFLMLRWHEEIEADPCLLDFCITYADYLLTLQDAEGYFPGWLHPDTLEPAEIMAQTPETSMSVTFLLKLTEITKDEKYSDAALKAMDVVIREVIPQGRWEDFETYWSCCGYGNQDHVGKKHGRNDMFKQNTFSMYWTAEALLEAYRTTGRKDYLQWGRRTLDELSMAQQVWQPPFIYVPALGGFGVMNFDGEWNDSRQTLFAELFMDYYTETGDKDLFERGICALKAGFIMMYCPENAKVKKLWEKVYTFFGPEDYGFTMENYGHIGATSPEGGGMGSFTIYDWGNGAASEARNRIYDHYGDVYIDRNRKQCFGVDSVSAEFNGRKVTLENRTDTPRDIKIVFEDGSSKEVRIEKTLDLKF